MVINEGITHVFTSLQKASHNFAKYWDGKESILKMKEADYRHWKQMEWLGFYFQFLCEQHFNGILEMPGRKYNNVEFDAFKEISWDFKAHATNNKSRKIITNDTEAIANTLNEYGYYGLVLAMGEVEYDDEAKTFKAWHDALKGGRSAYEIQRIIRGGKSRRRKTKFVLSGIQFLCLDSAALSKCSKPFQQGFKNSDGSPRREKIMINTREIPEAALVANKQF